MRRPILLNQTVPSIPPQGPASMGSMALCMGGRVSRRRRRQARLTGSMGDLVDVPTLISSGTYAGFPTGTVSVETSGGAGGDFAYDANGNQLTYQGNQLFPQDTSPAGSPGLGYQVGQAASAVVGAAASTATAVKYGIWVIGGLAAYMIFKEAQTPEGRARFGKQVKETASGAAHAAGTAAKAAIL